MRFVLLLLLVALGVGLSMLGDILLKKSPGFSSLSFLSGLSLYAAVAFPVALAFQQIEFGILFLMWEAVFVILGVVVGSVYFREPFTINKFLATIFIVAGIFLSQR